LNSSINPPDFSSEIQDQDLKPDKAFLNESYSEYEKNQKRLNPSLHKEAPKENFSKENHENQEKSEEIKEKGVKINENPGFISEQISKMKEELSNMSSERDKINEFSSKKTLQKSPLKLLNENFFKEALEFSVFLNDFAKENPEEKEELNGNIKENINKHLLVTIPLEKEEKRRENIMRNLMGILPKEAHLYVYEEEKLMVIEVNSQEIERNSNKKLLKAVLL